MIILVVTDWAGVQPNRSCQEQLQSIRWEIDLNSHFALLMSWQPNNSHRKSFEIEKFSPKCDVVYIGSLSFSVFYRLKEEENTKKAANFWGNWGLLPTKWLDSCPSSVFFVKHFLVEILYRRPFPGGIVSYDQCREVESSYLTFADVYWLVGVNLMVCGGIVFKMRSTICLFSLRLAQMISR